MNNLFCFLIDPNTNTYIIKTAWIYLMSYIRKGLNHILEAGMSAGQSVSLLASACDIYNIHGHSHFSLTGLMNTYSRLPERTL